MPSIRALVLAAAIATPASAFAQPSSLPIAYVNLQKILSEAPAAKQAAKELETLRQTRAQDLNARKQALDATKLQLANAGGLFQGTRREQLTAQLRKQEAELQQATQQAQTEYQERQRKLQSDLQTELNGVLSAIAKSRGIQYVLNQDTAVVLAPVAADLTKEVLDRLNALEAQKPAAK